MAGIAGILSEGKHALVSAMLETIAHRGRHARVVLAPKGATIGMVFGKHEESGLKQKLKRDIFLDGPGFGQMAEVFRPNGNWKILRDELGAIPMYFGYTEDDDLCFASEVKALAGISRRIHEVPPGSVIIGGRKKRYFDLKAVPAERRDPVTARELLNVLTLAVSRRITTDTMGSWLSGGLDSSAIAAVARPWLRRLHTFAGGLPGAPDLAAAREAARHIGSEHQEVVVQFSDLLRVLPAVIYHLESFDPWLVRSSLINYLVAERASGFVDEVFSGEGGDELFAGYDYLKSIPEEALTGELLDITGRLHNTAMQRVDRCASAHGLSAHVVFADPMVVGLAFSIPPGEKIRDGIEKWILRKAVEGLLPPEIAWRPKAKFWEGAGVDTMLAEHAAIAITDADFRAERRLPNGWMHHSKEELFYYRIFRDFFGGLENLDWMGRTKGMPQME